MKKAMFIMVVLAAFGLVLGCGSSGNKCDDAGKVMESGMDEGCSGKDDCCFCKCWNDGHKTIDDPVECTCKTPEGGDPVACEGDVLAAAEDCLADETACKDAAKALVDLACPAA